MSNNTNNIEVSVICNAYNHEKYIAQALESFIEQRTSFGFEVLVHDDASTDGTADIIREYERKYPNIIKPYYQTENQYQKHVDIMRNFQYSRANGKYYALCEGDDYWTDPMKLQKQYDLMEQHSEIDICSHGSVIIDAQTNEPTAKVVHINEVGVISARDVIDGGGGFVKTNSLFFRASLLENEPKFRTLSKLDYTLQILGALKGGMLYLPDIMSAYRKNVSTSWTKATMGDNAKKKALYKKLNAMLCQLDKDTNGKYRSVIVKHRLKNWLRIRIATLKTIVGK